MTQVGPLLQVEIKRLNNNCPFSNSHLSFALGSGQCLWIKGASGAGKSSIIRAIARIAPLPGTKLKTTWNRAIPKKQRIGVLFQQGVLIDSLNLYDNIALSCAKAGLPHNRKTILQHLTAVGLTAKDGDKMPGQLSGGMLRRASLAQILAQRKKIIVLDEPFVGLDAKTAQGIIETLKSIKKQGQTFIIIAHEENYAAQLADVDFAITLTPTQNPEKLHHKWLPHWRYIIRLAGRLFDYLGISLPLIICAFIATGLAISAIFTQLLDKVDLQAIMGQVAKHQPHYGFSSLIFSFVRHEVIHITYHYLPLVKQKLYSIVIMRTFVTQLGPLLTALLLAGRIGGSYTGEIAMMQATNQNQLLRTLSVSPRWWSLSTASVAGLVSAPILTAIGTAVGVAMSAWVVVHGAHPLFSSVQEFWQELRPGIFSWDGVKYWWQYPPYVNVYQSLGFMLIILVVSEICGRFNRYLQPRSVPKTITWAIVITSLLLLIADWGFTELLVMS